jgi:hypothetical protein
VGKVERSRSSDCQSGLNQALSSLHVFSSDMLMNRVNREADRVAKNIYLIICNRVVLIDEGRRAILVRGREGAEDGQRRIAD